MCSMTRRAGRNVQAEASKKQTSGHGGEGRQEKLATTEQVDGPNGRESEQEVDYMRAKLVLFTAQTEVEILTHAEAPRRENGVDITEISLLEDGGRVIGCLTENDGQ